MGKTSIEWADFSFNPWIGCTKVSEGCDHCYAETLAARRKWAQWGPKAPRVRTALSTWKQPRTWDRKARAEGRFDFVFCASLSDVFDKAAPQEWRRDLWQLIADTPNLTWLLLTKRPQLVAKMVRDFPGGWGDGPLNVWIGTSIEHQKALDARLAHFKAIPARRHFISAEPLLGPLDFGKDGLRGIDWVIGGCESGPGRRTFQGREVGWIRQLHKQCGDAGVDFFFKQWGDVPPIGQAAGKLDGYEIRERPSEEFQP